METATRTVDASFADVDSALADMTSSDVEQRFRDLELQRRRIDAEMATLADRAERSGHHRADGHRSTVGWIRAQLNCSNARITRLRRCGRLFRAHPSVGEALLAGHIGVDQAAELARAHANPRCGHLLGASLDLLLGHARRLKFDEFRMVVQRWEMFADLDGAERDRGDSVEARRALIAAGTDGVDLVVTGGTPLQAVGMQAILDAFAEAEYQADLEEARNRLGDDVDDSELRRTHAQRAFDAALRIFHTANNSPVDGTPPAATVEVVIDQYSFEHQLSRHGLAAQPTDLPVPGPAEARSHTAGGVPVHPEEVVAAALLGHVRRTVVDSRGVTIDYGRKERLFKGAAADAARSLVTRCEHPGCTIPEAWSQIDHMTEWEDLGRTDQANRAIFCGHHNRHKHRAKLRARRDRHGQVQLQRPDGTWIVPVGVDPPVGRDFEATAPRIA